MGSSSMVEARLDAVQDSIDGSIGKSYHGIAARLDRIPAGKAVRIVLWLSGGICFCDSIDMNIAGPIIAQFFNNRLVGQHAECDICFRYCIGLFGWRLNLRHCL